MLLVETAAAHGRKLRNGVRGGLGRVREGRAVLELVVLEHELFDDFSPQVRVEEVVGAALVGRRLLHGDHARCARYPRLFLLVVAPLAVVPFGKKTPKKSLRFITIFYSHKIRQFSDSLSEHREDGQRQAANQPRMQAVVRLLLVFLNFVLRCTCTVN